MDGLVASGTVVAEARRVAALVKQRLVELSIPGELSLTGSSSIPGLLTKADVDLHLRTSAGSFEAVVSQLGRHFLVAEPSAWGHTLAVFDVPDLGRATGIAVTPVGSEHDRRFTVAWSRLAADGQLRTEYNTLKRHAEDADGYAVLKSEFFDRLTQ